MKDQNALNTIGETYKNATQETNSNVEFFNKVPSLSSSENNESHNVLNQSESPVEDGEQKEEPDSARKGSFDAPTTHQRKDSSTPAPFGNLPRKNSLSPGVYNESEEDNCEVEETENSEEEPSSVIKNKISSNENLINTNMKNVTFIDEVQNQPTVIKDTKLQGLGQNLSHRLQELAGSTRLPTIKQLGYDYNQESDNELTRTPAPSAFCSEAEVSDVEPNARSHGKLLFQKPKSLLSETTIQSQNPIAPPKQNSAVQPNILKTKQQGEKTKDQATVEHIELPKHNLAVQSSILKTKQQGEEIKNQVVVERTKHPEHNSAVQSNISEFKQNDKKIKDQATAKHVEHAKESFFKFIANGFTIKIEGCENKVLAGFGYNKLPDGAIHISVEIAGDRIDNLST